MSGWTATVQRRSADVAYLPGPKEKGRPENDKTGGPATAGFIKRKEEE